MRSHEEMEPSALDENLSAVRLTPEEWVTQHGDYLFSHALARVGNREAAEDLVQETFVAGWKSRSKYAGRASERTWLFRILRNKIADYFRSLSKESQFTDLDSLADLELRQFRSGWFGAGHWHISVAPRPWKNPIESLDQQEFWEALYL